MDLNKIVLPAFTLAELYRSSLVLPDDKQKPVSPADTAAKGEIKWLGNNRKNILIAVHYDDAVHLPDQDLELLTSILAACKLGLEDVVVINLKNFPEPGYKELNDQFSCKQTILFGIEPAKFGLPMSFPHFQIQSFLQTSYLFSPSLTRIGNDRNLKTSLWQSLKLLFQL
jgi:hypothetical protein